MSSHMSQEIHSQGSAWDAALEAVEAHADAWRELCTPAAAREVRLLGAGSSYYLGVAARPVFARRGFTTSAVPAAEQLLQPADYPLGKGLLALAVSRSGTTTETLRALRKARSAGAATGCITTARGTPMAEASDVSVEVVGAAETSTVQTRSFTAALAALVALASHAVGDEATLRALWSLPQRADAWVEQARDAVAPFAQGVDAIALLGTGARWGLAMEGALKLKETSLSVAEAFQTLEFRHGPQSMVDASTLVVGLVGGPAREAEAAVLREMAGHGGRVLVIGPDVDGLVPGATALDLPSTGSDDADLPLYLPPLQLLALARGVAKGLDPDHPRHLSFAVELDDL